MRERKQIIIAKATSGLGNRILAACTAILYAEIVGAQVYLDWTEGNYSDIGDNAFEKFFECISPAYISELPPDIFGSTSVYPVVWQGRLNTSFGNLATELSACDTDLSFDITQDTLKEDVLVFCAYTHKIHKMRHLFKGDYSFLNKLNNSQVLRLLLERFFVLRNPVKDLVETYSREKFSASTIGVHIRYTDMKISVEDIIKNVKKIVGKDIHRKIFLATDSQDIIRRFKITFPGTIVAPKWFPEEGGRLHLKDHYDKFQIGVEALRDLYLLAECNYLVYSSRSSFGRIASLVSKAPPKNIYDIERPSLVVRIKNKVKSKLKRLF
jgi:Nodulation protein Z (NodZ)